MVTEDVGFNGTQLAQFGEERFERTQDEEELILNLLTSFLHVCGRNVTTTLEYGLRPGSL